MARKERVLVPYRGIYFLYGLFMCHLLTHAQVLVPYRGIYFLYGSPVQATPRMVKSSRPLSGNLFSLRMGAILMKK